jgi:thioredoxin reductase
MYDLIILGAGPAGLSCAMYAMRKRLDFLVVSENLGGKTNMIITLPDVEDYTIIKAREQVSVYRSRLHYRSELLRKETILSLKATEDSHSHSGYRFETMTKRADGTIETYQSRAVLLATGTSITLPEVPGMKQFWGRGLGTNIQSYNHAFWGKEVFLYGESTRVLWDALDLASFAQKVYLGLSPEGTYEMEVLEQVRTCPGILLCEDSQIVGFQGNDFCKSVEIQCSSHLKLIRADGFFLELDAQPVIDFVDPDLVLRTNEYGLVEVDKMMQTSVSGLFAAGDVSDMGRCQVLTALGQGASAAISLYQWLKHFGTKV